MMWESDYTYIEIPPLRLKQFATNKAAAEKDLVIKEIYKRWGVEFKTNDEADAYVLAQIARAVKLTDRNEELNLTQFQCEVVDKIIHPEKKGAGKGKRKEGKKAGKEAA